MTQCVVVLGLLCVEMCLLWSWFGLFFNFFFWTCTSVLLLFVPLVCLSVNFELLLRLFILQRRVYSTNTANAPNTNPHKPSPPALTPSLFAFPSHKPDTLQHTQLRPKTPLTPHNSHSALLSVCRFYCWLTFLFSCSHGKPVNKQRALTVKQTA